jgi:hypothetical protein
LRIGPPVWCAIQRLMTVSTYLRAAAVCAVIRISFEPVFVRWKVDYMAGMGGGDPATQYDPGRVAKAAEKRCTTSSASLTRKAANHERAPCSTFMTM